MAEDSWILQYATQLGIKGNFYTGLNRLIKTQWSWTDGSPLDYTKWAPGTVFHDAAFDQAETVCTSTGGHLTSIHSDEENAFVLSLTHMGIEYRNEKQLTWIGLRKPNYPANATWAWTDGSKVDYFNWAPGKPENITGLQDCAQMYTDSLDKNPVRDTDFKRWNDVQCSLTMRAYVCKEAALH
ncbi:lectin C-type domain protein [Necator americanus]|uniref:Lectin C-type domain protein n=1 Tax=Necator americanus TaxID=51031 RepID=W2TQC6_NECAM|nr:lectin C-type domain protein [Necator americanus]ETN83311.1 lectin C-type domain protein [Necator americanus]